MPILVDLCFALGPKVVYSKSEVEIREAWQLQQTRSETQDVAMW